MREIRAGSFFSQPDTSAAVNKAAPKSRANEADPAFTGPCQYRDYGKISGRAAGSTGRAVRPPGAAFGIRVGAHGRSPQEITFRAHSRSCSVDWGSSRT